MQKLRLDVWSDIACPWCYIGKRHLEAALAEFPHKDEVEVVWRAFELDPTAPKQRSEVTSNVERLASKYHVSEEQARTMMARVIHAGNAAGLDLKLYESKSGNTFDAHRMLHWAHEQGKQDALKERMMRAYQTEGQVIADPDVLVACAKDVGLPEDEAKQILAGDRYTAEVRADESHAKELGISGVPFFVLGGKIGVSGAQPVATMKEVLAKAWAELPKLETIVEGATCGPDGCD
ncbi:MAG TPA: DsbA family oxidoreductase [Kofleriaceae bacterium]